MPEVRPLDSGRWGVRWRDALGQRHSAGFSFPTKAAARAYGQDREAEVRRGEDLDPRAGRVLLGDYAQAWLDETYIAEPRTVAKVRTHVTRYIKAPVGDARALGDMRLTDLDSRAVQAWVKRLIDLGRAPATVAAIHRTLCTILNAAVKDRSIRANPALDVTLPTLAPPSDFYWERAETDAILAQLVRPLDRAVFLLLLGSGMRWGEMAGLHRDRWHALRRQVSVVEVLEEERGLRLKAYPKGKKRRELPVAKHVVEAVALWLSTSPVVPCGLQHPRGQRCSGLLFHDDGRPLSRHAWPREVLRPAIDAAGVRPGTPHDLRHTYASWLVLDGVPLRVVQDLLGHASSRMTERYSHLAPSALNDPRLLKSLGRRPKASAARGAESLA